MQRPLVQLNSYVFKQRPDAEQLAGKPTLFRLLVLTVYLIIFSFAASACFCSSLSFPTHHSRFPDPLSPFPWLFTVSPCPQPILPLHSFSFEYSFSSLVSFQTSCALHGMQECWYGCHWCVFDRVSEPLVSLFLCVSLFLSHVFMPCCDQKHAVSSSRFRISV